jgi:hypothetical protein
VNKQRQPTDIRASVERMHAYRHRQPTDHKRRETGEAAHVHRRGSGVKLVPPGPPGRITRKARDFEADIVQLRAQGYTLDAIRQALEAAGVRVSISTVRRESLRRGRTAPASQATFPKSMADLPAAVSQDAAPVAAPNGSVNAAPAAWLKGRDVAEAYMRDLVTNPLYRAKEKR